MVDSIKFNITARGWFLTYPQCSLAKEEVLQALKDKGRVILQAVVSRELHEDGTPHIHAYLFLSDRFNTKNSRFWDIGNFHGNYQSAKSLKAVVKYIKKDGDFIQEGIDYKAEIHSIEAHKAYLGKRLIEGESLVDLTKEYPELLFKYEAIKRSLAVFRADCVPSLPLCTGFIPNSFGVITPLLSSKQRHYWFWSSKANKGKTTFLKSIQAQYPSLWYSWAEKYQSSCPHAQFVLLDEFSIPHLTIMQLNQMCDGTWQYPVKGADSFPLTDPIILVCGNLSPLEVYSEKHHGLIQARFNIHCLDAN